VAGKWFFLWNQGMTSGQFLWRNLAADHQHISRAV